MQNGAHTNHTHTNHQKYLVAGQLDVTIPQGKKTHQSHFMLGVFQVLHKTLLSMESHHSICDIMEQINISETLNHMTSHHRLVFM